jgi:hypothetical protein
MNEGTWGTGSAGGLNVTVYTDAYVVRGSVTAGQGSLADIFDSAEDDVVLLSDVTLDEYGSRTGAVRTEFAQINVATVLFAVAGTSRDAGEEVLTATAPDQILVSIPPFRIIGRLEGSGAGGLREAVQGLRGRFVEVVDAVYSSELAAEARTPASRLAVNRARAHAIAPHREVDPWAGLAPGAQAGSGADASVGGSAQVDPWGQGAPTAAAPDPWRTEPSATPAPNDPWRDPPGGPPPSNPWGSPGGDPFGAGKPRRDDDLIG